MEGPQNSMRRVGKSGSCCNAGATKRMKGKERETKHSGEAVGCGLGGDDGHQGSKSLGMGLASWQLLQPQQHLQQPGGLRRHHQKRPQPARSSAGVYALPSTAVGPGCCCRG